MYWKSHTKQHEVLSEFDFFITAHNTQIFIEWCSIHISPLNIQCNLFCFNSIMMHALFRYPWWELGLWKKKRDSFIIIAIFHSICRYNLNTMKKSEVFSLNIWNLYWTLKSITMLWNSLLVSPRYDFLSTKRKVGYLSPESKLLTNELHVIHLRWNCVAFILSTFNDDVPSFTIMEPFIKLTPW